MRQPLLRRLLSAVLLLLPLGGSARADDELEAALRRTIGQRLWYGVYMMKEKVGYALTEAAETKIGTSDAVAFTVKAHMKVTTLGQRQEVTIEQARVYRRTGELHSISSRLKSGPSDVEITCTVGDGKMVVASRMGVLTNQKDLPAPRESLKDFLAAEALAAPQAQVGQQVTLTEFDPTLLKEIEIVLTLKERRTITYNGVPTRVCVIASKMPALGVETQMFVAEDGVAFETSLGEMLVMRLEPEQVAKDTRYSTDIIRLGCVPLKPPPEHVAQSRSLRLQVWGIQDDALAIDDDRQKWTKQPDGSRIVAIDVPATDPKAAAKRPVADARFARDLEPTLYAQSDDEGVKALASKIVGDERDAYAAAKKINHWVYTNLRKEGTPALSNAVETLRARAGDCTEHTILFVALARAAGIPAREIAGVTAIEGGEGLYYHAWPEVWVGQWVAMDPTLNQEVADATHLKLAQGGPENLFRIVSIFGRLKASVVPAPAR